jgi:glycine/D-amino acid oxidase-like deaminating enzyme
MIHLNNNLERKKAGLPTEQFLIAEEISFISDIPQKFDGIYKRAPQKDILDLLETKNATYIACVSYQKGCLNSAFFCEKVLAYLSETYPDRFSIFEHTQIKKIILKNDHCLLDADKHVVKAQKTILCTNGFDHVVIFTDSGLDVDTKFHHMVEGTVGYMSGYIESVNKPPIAISYLTDPDPSTDDPYYYLTRREYDFLGNKNQNLISIGGPEISLEDRSVYSKDAEYPDEIIEQIDSFVKANYDKDPSKKIEYIFTWHGLMGYTKNGVRLIGAEPKHPNLLYNLGCNGVGILPSIFGGKKISDIIDGKIQEKSIFDIPTNK